MRTGFGYPIVVLWRPRGQQGHGGAGLARAAALHHLVQHQAHHAVAQRDHCAQKVQQAQLLRRSAVLARQRQQQPLDLVMRSKNLSEGRQISSITCSPLAAKSLVPFY